MSKTQVIITCEIIPDDNPDASYLEREGWEDRLQEYRDGAFSFVGVRAVASLKLPHGRAWIETTIKSPGLWGIESDSSDDYIQEVFQEERAVLLEMLEDMRTFVVVE